MTKLKRLNVSLVDVSEVSVFKSFCKIQGIELPEEFNEKFNAEDSEAFIPALEFPVIIFDDLGVLTLAEEPDEDYVSVYGLDAFMYLYEKFQDQTFILQELKNAGTFENLYIKLLEEGDDDFEFDEPESWESEEEDDEECECQECECELEGDQMMVRVSLPVKLAFNNVEAIRGLVENLESVGFEAREVVRDTDLFIAIYEDKTYETMESSRTYLGLDIPEA